MGSRFGPAVTGNDDASEGASTAPRGVSMEEIRRRGREGASKPGAGTWEEFEFKPNPPGPMVYAADHTIPYGMRLAAARNLMGRDRG